MTDRQRYLLRRTAAFGADWMVMAIWACAVFAVVMVMSGGHPRRPESATVAQGLGLLVMTVPVVLYFAFCESSRMRGSLGKRVLGLVVTESRKPTLSFPTALLRNAVKFAPWEIGHWVANQAIYSGDENPGAFVFVMLAIACLCPAWWFVALAATGQTPYDRWTSTQVTLREP